MFAFLFPSFDPVLIQIGPVKVHWYGLAYAAGIILGWRYAIYLAKNYVTTVGAKQLDNFVAWAVVGIIVGGRLGHVLFYDLGHYLNHPFEIIMTWKGGMSFHGGLIGVMIVTFIYCQRHAIPLFQFADILAAAAPIGLGLGRLANFINNELYGRVTEVPWAVYFPHAGPLPRHPSQLYEAFAEGFLLWFCLAWAWRRPWLRNHPGRITGLFLLGYGLMRFLVEYVREPEIIYPIGGCLLTQGQMLSVPLVIVGMYWLKRKNA